MNKENIDMCCIQETHLQKDMTFKARGYQCFRTDRWGDRRQGGIITLIKSNISTVNHKAWDMTTSINEERILKHIRTITNSHALINRMTHRLATPDAGTLPVHHISHYVQIIYTASHERSRRSARRKWSQTSIPNLRSKNSAFITNTKVETQESKLTAIHVQAPHNHPN